MNVLVLNCGSSSLKYRLLAMPEARELAAGEAQRVGPRTAEPARIFHHTGGQKTVHTAEMPDHATAFDEVLQLLARTGAPKPDALGHRLVHGGSRFSDAAVIDAPALRDLQAIQKLAPLHNPPATALIAACSERYPDLPQVAVFDTAFHATIPEQAATYALPTKLTAKLGIRKYGFHGTSHQFVVEEAAKFLHLPLAQFTAVSCHLGSGGASLCAVVNGRSVDNTMGFSPLQGLVMSTRCGDLDPSAALRLLIAADGNPGSVEKTLNKTSGVLGLSGTSADIRDVLAATARGATADARMQATSQVYLWRLRKYLGAYLATVGRADAIIFTDTIGETLPEVRAAVCADLDCFGVRMDFERNAAGLPLPCDVATADSPTRILVVATNEELAIGRRTYATLNPGAHQTAA